MFGDSSAGGRPLTFVLEIEESFMESKDLRNFVRWFVIPYQTLKNIPNGDGGFVAMSIGLSLCERWHRIEKKEQDNYKKEEFKKAAAEYLSVDEKFFEDFWDVFRNGIQHQGQPKWRKGNGADRKPYGWLFSHEFESYPKLGTDTDGKEYICIDPFAFTDQYIDLFLSDPQKLSEAVHHSFGEIRETTLATLEEVRPS